MRFFGWRKVPSLHRILRCIRNLLSGLLILAGILTMCVAINLNCLLTPWTHTRLGMAVLIQPRLITPQRIPEMCLCTGLLEFINHQTDKGTVLSSCATCSDFFIRQCSAFLSCTLVVPAFSYPVALILSNHVSGVVSSIF